LNLVFTLSEKSLFCSYYDAAAVIGCCLVKIVRDLLIILYQLFITFLLLIAYQLECDYKFPNNWNMAFKEP
jgi:hypothetical protein